MAGGQPAHRHRLGRYQLSQVQRAHGRLDAAAETCQQTLAMTAGPGRLPAPAAGPAHVGLGEAERAAPGSAGLLNPVPAQRARLLLAQGDLDAAARWTEDSGLTADDEPDYPRESGHMVLARVLLALGRGGPALALLDRRHAAAAAQGRADSIIEAAALRALALAGIREEAAAVSARTGALTLGHPHGYIRVFADEGAPMAALLARFIVAQRASRPAAVARAWELGLIP